MSYLELYNEEVRDLLGKNPLAKLEVRERTDIGVYVKDLSSFVVKNADEMDKLMAVGNRNSEFSSFAAILKCNHTACISLFSQDTLERRT